MKKICFIALCAAMATSINLMACNNGSSATQDSQAAAESTESVDATEAQAAPEAVVEDVVEEFAAGSVLPEKPEMPVVIDFNADWCGPCQRFKPVFHKVAADYKGKARFISVNVDNNGELARRFRVSSIPQITILTPDGNVVNTVGAMDEAEFVAFLSKTL